jgi:hypothetical protein
MIRNTILAVALALGTTAALADNNWAFDDAYWKQAPAAPSVQATQTTQSVPAKGSYDFVNQYNY